MDKQTRHAWIVSGAIITLFIAGVIWLVASAGGQILTSPEKLRDYIRGFGAWGPLVIIGIHIAQVVIAPLPGQAIEIANGYLFGGVWGSVVSMIGITIGSILAISLARYYGRPLVAMLVTPAGMKHVNPYARRRNYLFFYLLFLVPGTPDDLICFAIGLTSIPLRHAIALALVGRAPFVIGGSVLGAAGIHFHPLVFIAIAVVIPVLLSFIFLKTPLAEKMKLPKTPDGQ